VFCSFSLLAVTGGPLFYGFRKRNIQVKQKKALLVVFLVASISLCAIMVPLLHSSAVNKARTQMYITELENQGFNVEYGEHYPYGHWHVEYVDSFSSLIKIAKDNECETVFVHGGVPSYFLFFVPPYIQIVAAQTGQGYYIFVDNQYN
jgi:hypothetical protein